MQLCNCNSSNTLIISKLIFFPNYHHPRLSYHHFSLGWLQMFITVTFISSLGHLWFFFFFFFGCTMQHVELPWPGIEPASPAVEAWCLNHWTTREVLPILSFFRVKFRKIQKLCYRDHPRIFWSLYSIHYSEWYYWDVHQSMSPWSLIKALLWLSMSVEQKPKSLHWLIRCYVVWFFLTWLPCYLSELISYYSPPCLLYYSHTNLLTVSEVWQEWFYFWVFTLGIPIGLYSNITVS